MAYDIINFVEEYEENTQLSITLLGCSWMETVVISFYFQYKMYLNDPFYVLQIILISNFFKCHFTKMKNIF